MGELFSQGDGREVVRQRSVIFTSVVESSKKIESRFFILDGVEAESAAEDASQI